MASAAQLTFAGTQRAWLGSLICASAGPLPPYQQGPLIPKKGKLRLRPKGACLTMTTAPPRQWRPTAWVCPSAGEAGQAHPQAGERSSPGWGISCSRGTRQNPQWALWDQELPAPLPTCLHPEACAGPVTPSSLPSFAAQSSVNQEARRWGD